MGNINTETLPSSVPKNGLTIFRFDEIDPVRVTGEEPFWVTEGKEMTEGFHKLVEVGWLEGIEFKVLLDVPGFNLTYGRLKPGFTVPLHHHHGEGVYFVIAGTAFYGNVKLTAGDGLFQPAHTPYSLTAGEDGLEIIEIRTVGGAETMFLSNSGKYWQNFLEKTVAAKESWPEGWPEKMGEMEALCRKKEMA